MSGTLGDLRTWLDDAIPRIIATSPSLSYMLSANLVRLCACLDGGAVYGMPAGAAAAPLLGDPERSLRIQLLQAESGSLKVAQMGLWVWSRSFFVHTQTLGTERRRSGGANCVGGEGGGCGKEWSSSREWARARLSLRRSFEVKLQQLEQRRRPEAEVGNMRELTEMLTRLQVPPMNTSAVLDVCLRLLRSAADVLAGAAGSGPRPIPQHQRRLQLSLGAAVVLVSSALRCMKNACGFALELGSWAGMPPGTEAQLQACLRELLRWAVLKLTLAGGDTDYCELIEELDWGELGYAFRLNWQLRAEGGLPTSPPPPIAAPLAAGLVPSMELLMRGSRMVEEVQSEFLPAAMSRSGCVWALVLAFGDRKQSASLVATVAKMLRRAALQLPTSPAVARALAAAGAMGFGGGAGATWPADPEGPWQPLDRALGLLDSAQHLLTLGGVGRGEWRSSVMLLARDMKAADMVVTAAEAAQAAASQAAEAAEAVQAEAVQAEAAEGEEMDVAHCRFLNSGAMGPAGAALALGRTLSYVTVQLLPAFSGLLYRAVELYCNRGVGTDFSRSSMVLACMQVLLSWMPTLIAAAWLHQQADRHEGEGGRPPTGPPPAGESVARDPTPGWLEFLIQDLKISNVLGMALALIKTDAQARTLPYCSMSPDLLEVLHMLVLLLPEQFVAMVRQGDAAEAAEAAAANRGATKLRAEFWVSSAQLRGLLGNDGYAPDSQLLEIVEETLSGSASAEGGRGPSRLFSFVRGATKREVRAVRTEAPGTEASSAAEEEDEKRMERVLAERRRCLFAASRLVSPALARKVLTTCSNPGCINLEGPSEAALKLRVCDGGCGGRVRYCSPGCQAAHWPVHSGQCAGVGAL